MLFAVKKIGSALAFEALDIVAPCGFDFVCAFALLDHCADIAATYQQFEKWCEKFVAHAEVAIGVDKIFEIDALTDGLIVADVAEVYAVAEPVEKRRLFSTFNAARSEAHVSSFHVGMTVDHKGLVCSATEADGSGFEIA